jgi:hypothetical protein
MVNISAASDAKRPLSLTSLTPGLGVNMCEHNALSKTCWAAAQPYPIGDRGLRGDGFSGRFVRRSEIAATTAAGKLVFGIFAALAKFERELISERTTAGLAWPAPEAAKAGGRSS